MDPALLVVGAAAALALAAVLCVLLTVALSGRRRLRRDLDAARAALDDLGRRVADLSTPAAPQPRVRPAGEYVITTVGDGEAEQADEPTAGRELEPLTAGQFASVAVGESLVRILSFGHGVRRALSAENRNRIAFEMRREVRRSRKQRRRDLKEARRHLRTAQRDDLAEDAA